MHERKEEALAKFLALQVGTTSNKTTTDLAWAVWKAFCGDGKQALPVPYADAGEDGSILLWWDSPNTHFEIDVGADGILNIFYRDSVTGKIDSRECRFDPAGNGKGKIVSRLIP